MGVLKTTKSLSQTFQNVGRLSEIVGVLVKHGFADLIQRMKLSKFIPPKYREHTYFQKLPTSVRLRMSFEELGPTFIKLGQLLSTRRDLIPEDFANEFEKLQDKVQAHDFNEILKIIESEYNKKVSEVFLNIESEPIAAASIAQVHLATLKTKELVAVKIQRPQIIKTINNDISILKGLSILLEQYISESRPFNPKELVEEFARVMSFELDFRIEANNISKIKNNMSQFPKIVIPKVYNGLSTKKILVLEKFDGIRFSDREAIIRANINPIEIFEVGAEAFFHMVMHDGLFHADLHAGNLFVLKDGKIGLVDFGIVGRLPRNVQDSVITMFSALVDEDYEILASEYLDLCSSRGPVNLAAMQKELMDLISPYMGMTLAEINIGSLLLQSTTVAAKYSLRVPRELMLLFKAIFNLESLGKNLEPNFDILKLGTKQAKNILAVRYSKERFLHNIVVMGREAQAILERLPSLIKRYLHVWSENNFEITNRDIRHLSQSIRIFTFFFVLSIASLSAMSLGITMLFFKTPPLWKGVSILGFFMMGLSVFLVCYGFFTSRKLLKE